jgi:hypothetical protein
VYIHFSLHSSTTVHAQNGARYLRTRTQTSVMATTADTDVDTLQKVVARLGQESLGRRAQGSRRQHQGARPREQQGGSSH